jgi:small nuclear ribonucleoprotein (snRNP)-like protein
VNEKMGYEIYLKKNVVIELKSGSKFFGKIISVDFPSEINSLITIEKNNKQQTINASEIARVEELR